MDDAGAASQPVLPVLVPVWQEPASVPREAVQLLAEALSIPEPLCVLLVQRGLTDPEQAKGFLRPLLSDLHPAAPLAGSKEAVGRILEAIDRGETVLVHGDYDVDGVSGTALLARWIRRMGGAAVPFVPHRIRDGYDLGPAGVEAAQTAGAVVLVYDHHKRDLQARLTELQHQSHANIIATMHSHLDHNNCIEVVLLRGSAAELQEISEKLIATRGVKHGRLMATSLGSGLA